MSSNLIVAAVRDRASVNGVAMRTIKVIMDIFIFSPSIVFCELKNGNALRQSISVALGFDL